MDSKLERIRDLINAKEKVNTELHEFLGGIDAPDLSPGISSKNE